MKKHIRLNVLPLAALLAFSTMMGCGGAGNGLTNRLAGPRSISYSSSTSAEGGYYELIINQDGSFKVAPIVYSYNNQDGFELRGTVQSGYVNADGTIRLESKIDHETYPIDQPLASPYYTVAVGRLTLTGAHYEGQVTIKYYETTDFGPGQEEKSISYEIYSGSLPPPGAHQYHTQPLP